MKCLAKMENVLASMVPWHASLIQIFVIQYFFLLWTLNLRSDQKDFIAKPYYYIAKLFLSSNVICVIALLQMQKYGNQFIILGVTILYFFWKKVEFRFGVGPWMLAGQFKI